MAEQKDGCVKAAKGPILPSTEPKGSAGQTAAVQEVIRMQARVGAPAIDFEANAYVEGAGFKTVKLSDYKGKWIVLCFYPGDFTFV
jgi:peroxiredoxin (alkyl hydroperoxide reductase subunit C)